MHLVLKKLWSKKFTWVALNLWLSCKMRHGFKDCSKNKKVDLYLKCWSDPSSSSLKNTEWSRTNSYKKTSPVRIESSRKIELVSSHLSSTNLLSAPSRKHIIHLFNLLSSHKFISFCFVHATIFLLDSRQQQP